MIVSCYCLFRYKVSFGIFIFKITLDKFSPGLKAGENLSGTKLNVIHIGQETKYPLNAKAEGQKMEAASPLLFKSL